jgi:hypothetical protein
MAARTALGRGFTAPARWFPGRTDAARPVRVNTDQLDIVRAHLVPPPGSPGGQARQQAQHYGRGVGPRRGLKGLAGQGASNGRF